MKDNIIKILEALKSNKVDGKNVEESVVLHAGNELIKDINWLEIKNILSKLDKKKIINVESLPYTPELVRSGVDPGKDKRNRYYRIKLLKGFDDYLQSYFDETHKNESEVCLWISYPDNIREVLLNDIIIISKPNFNSVNDLVFNYLYNNPNKTITKSALERELNTPITKRLHDIVQELGFKKELGKIFFSVSKTQIAFKNPITKQDLDDLGHPKFRLSI
jgi:hypothetical protein